MSAPSTLAAERTQLARVRTVVAALLTSTIVARAALPHWPAATLTCLAVAVVAVGSRLHRAPLGPGRAAVLVAIVVALAVAGLVTTVR